MTIETLLNQAEGKTLEFKRDLSSPKNLLKTNPWKQSRLHLKWRNYRLLSKPARQQ